MPASPRPPGKSSRPSRSAARRSGPGRTGSTRAARMSGPPASSTPARTGVAQRGAAGAPAPKPRLTGRAAILVLVLAVLAVSYASSMRAYLQQRSHIEGLQSTITERQAEIDDLEREKDRWLDPEFVRTEARERLGYVLPGETPFVALRDGEPLAAEGELSEPDTEAATPRAFWDDAWDSVLLAGNPPRRADPPPLTRVEAPEQDSDEAPQ